MFAPFAFAAIALMALLLGGAYFYSVYEIGVLRDRYPPRGGFADIDGTTLHYVDSGTGSPIVLLHGANSSLVDFEASIAPPLRKRHRVISIDRPGYGFSTRPEGSWTDPADQAATVHALLKRIGVESAVVVGHSLGGAVAMAYALAYPRHTAAVILLGGVSHPWKRGVAWTNHVAMWPLVGPLFANTLVVPGGELALAKAIAAVFAPNHPPPGYEHKTAVRLALRPGPFRASAEDILRLSPYLAHQSQHYVQLKMPMLLITGENDTVVPAWNHSERLVKLLPNAKLVSIPNTGHAPHHVHVPLVVRQISDFVNALGAPNDA
ncbi:MAG: alpha/beta hydrolase [Chromatiales bacterium]|jgi:pimeloyl-ACP methyl ester carboxylesterase|nr:alpha/beta hydrolase [Chromatiales bacterium]